MKKTFITFLFLLLILVCVNRVEAACYFGSPYNVSVNENSSKSENCAGIWTVYCQCTSQQRLILECDTGNLPGCRCQYDAACAFPNIPTNTPTPTPTPIPKTYVCAKFSYDNNTCSGVRAGSWTFLDKWIASNIPDLSCVPYGTRWLRVFCCTADQRTVTNHCGGNSSFYCPQTDDLVYYYCSASGWTSTTPDKSRCEYNSSCVPTNPPGQPTATKTPTPTKTPIPTATPAPPGGATLTPTPTINPSCVCSSNSCHSSCSFNKRPEAIFSSYYKDPLGCNLPVESPQYASTPNVDNKNSWCQRSLRTQGDADGKADAGGNYVTNTDYFYYVAAVNGGKIPATVNPDFDGDGSVSNRDREIIIKTLNSGATVVTTAPGQPTNTPTPTLTITPTPTLGFELEPTGGITKTPKTTITAVPIGDPTKPSK